MPEQSRAGAANRTKGLPGRVLLLLLGMMVAALGIVTITLSGLGTTPISTIPLTLTAITGLSFGTTTLLVNIGLILMQWLLLGRMSWALALQLPSVALFGAMLDCFVWLTAPLSGWARSGYLIAWLVSLLGNVLLAVGITLQVHSRTILQSGEGAVLALSLRARRPFGWVKIAFDFGCSALAALIGWLCLGAVTQVREGTLVSAFMVGFVARVIERLTRPRG